MSGSTAPSPEILFFDTFDSENGGNGALNYFSFTNWNVSNGTVDLIGNGFWDFLPGNGLYVDLDGTSYEVGKLETKTGFSLSTGNYVLQFDLAGSQRGDTNYVTVQC